MKKKKKKSCNIVGIFSLIVLILMIIIILILTGVISLDDKNILNDDSGIKLDSSKDYIYLANYSYENEYREYERKNVEKNQELIIDDYGFEIKYNTKTQNLNDLIVPHININTMDAINANDEIEDLYISYAQEFDKCASDENEVGCVQVLNYFSYLYNDILSLVIIDGMSENEDFVFNYSTYNFDLTTGNLLNYDKFLEKIGYSKEDVEFKLGKELEGFLNNKYADKIEQLNNCKFSLDEKEKNDTCLNASKLLFQEEIENDEGLYYVDDKGVLNILAIPYFSSVENENNHHYLFQINK